MNTKTFSYRSLQELDKKITEFNLAHPRAKYDLQGLKSARDFASRKMDNGPMIGVAVLEISYTEPAP